MVFFKKWVRNHPKFLLHFLIHIDVHVYASEKIIKMENSLLFIFGKIWQKSRDFGPIFEQL